MASSSGRCRKSPEIRRGMKFPVRMGPVGTKVCIFAFLMREKDQQTGGAREGEAATGWTGAR
jgi:hypothetical protein